MSTALLILSEDAIFSRMLELEFCLRGIATCVASGAEAGETADVILVDLDTALPPADCDGRVIGFTRSFSILASDPERHCSMILHRPFSMALLAEEVLALLPREHGDAVSKVFAQKKTLVLTDCSLSFGDRSVTLSKTEAALMECLLSARPQVLSRKTLEDVIGASCANKTDVYICFLRKKLEALTGSPMIRTVRGIGYRLE